MAVPLATDLNSLSLLGIAREKVYDDYNSSSSISGKISLKMLTTGETPAHAGWYGSGASGFEATNQNQCTASSYMGAEDNNAPYKMSEWWGYDHDVNVFTIYRTTNSHAKTNVLCSYTTSTALYYTGTLAAGTRLYTAITRCFHTVDGSIVDQRFKTAGKYGYASSHSASPTGVFEVDANGDIVSGGLDNNAC